MKELIFKKWWIGLWAIVLATFLWMSHVAHAETKVVESHGFNMVPFSVIIGSSAPTFLYQQLPDSNTWAFSDPTYNWLYATVIRSTYPWAINIATSPDGFRNGRYDSIPAVSTSAPVGLDRNFPSITETWNFHQPIWLQFDTTGSSGVVRGRVERN